MADNRLLQIILEESQNSPRGEANGKEVARRYGAGFQEAFIVLVREGMIASSGPVDTITLSPAGRRAAAR